jgi:hypothetical protein
MLGRRDVMVALAVACSACGNENGPDDDPYVGRWKLTTIDGQALPAQKQVVAAGLPAGLVVGARLVILDGTSLAGYDYCLEDEKGDRRLEFPNEIRYAGSGDGFAALIIIYPLWVAIDTISLASGTLTWEYNVRSEPSGGSTDLLRFERITDTAAYEYRGTPCNFDGGLGL